VQSAQKAKKKKGEGVSGMGDTFLAGMPQVRYSCEKDLHKPLTNLVWKKAPGKEKA